MRTVKTLTKALGANLEMPKPGQKSKARAYGIFGMIAFAGIMIPSAVMVGYITYLLSNLLMFFGQRSYALISMIHIISAFTMIFCLPVMFNVLYFVKDLAYFAVLPIRPVDLYRAKFRHTFRTENSMTAFVLLTMFAGWYKALYDNFGIREITDPVTIISSVTGLFLIPALPLIYCSIISTVLMGVLRRVKRISVFYYSSTVLFVMFAAVFLMSFRGQGGTNIEKYVDMLVAGNNSFNDLCDIIFFTTPMICRAMSEKSILWLIIPVVSTAVLYMIMLVCARFMYREGLYTAMALGGSKRRSRSRSFVPKKHGVFAALLRKEMAVLFRTMSYRTNCVYANLIWPILSVVFFVLSKKNVNILRFTALYRSGQARTSVLVLIVVLGISFIAAGLNSIASTSFTREGLHFDMIKCIPVRLSRIVFAKASANIILTYIPLSLAIGFAAYSLKASLFYVTVYLLLALLCVIISTIVGICMDSITPYTVWADEATALRGNMNCFFNLAAGLLIAAAVCGGTYGLYLLTGSAAVCLYVLTPFLAVLTIAGTLFGLRFVARNIDSL